MSIRMNAWHLGVRLLRDFAKNHRGGLIVMVGAAIVPLVALLGLATDSARGYLVKARLSQAVDAAALAGGRAMFQDYQNAEIQKYFDANFPAGYMNAQLDPLVVNVDEVGSEVEVTASAQIPTTFLRVLNVDDMQVSARAVVHRAIRGLELVLVMDNTGSMRSGGKIDAMKDAAEDLVQILYGERETVEDFWVALVPYAATVNVGPENTDWILATIDMDDLYDGTGTTWKGCVEARHLGGLDETDDTPDVQRWAPHFWESTLGVYGPFIGDGDNDWPPIREENAWENDGSGPNLGCGPAITPLVAEKSAVLDAIEEMEPWHRGGTMANLGLAWGWRVISPRWRGLWDNADPTTLPLDYDEELMDKAVILLTDGVNQWYNWPDAPPDSDYTAYGRLNEERLGAGINTNSEAKTEVNARMLQLCTSMKAEDIIVYTITFQENDPATQDLYRDCATSPDHYYNSPTNEDLAVAFNAIGTELSNLRLSE